MRVFIVLLSLFLTMPVAAEDSVIQIDDLVVNEPIPGQSVSAGYMTFSNSSNDTVTLLRVEANFAARVEMHQTMNMNGMNQMRPLQSVPIEPGASLKFEHGGRHLMIMGLDRTQTTEAELTFYFDNDLVLTQAVEWTAW